MEKRESEKENDVETSSHLQDFKVFSLRLTHNYCHLIHTATNGKSHASDSFNKKTFM